MEKKRNENDKKLKPRTRHWRTSGKTYALNKFRTSLKYAGSHFKIEKIFSPDSFFLMLSIEVYQDLQIQTQILIEQTKQNKRFRENSQDVSYINDSVLAF